MRLFSLTMAAVGLVLAAAGLAQGVTVDYTVTGWGPQQFPGPDPVPDDAPHRVDGYPGDTVEFETFTGTLDLTPGTYEQKVNTLLWSIDYTWAGGTNPNAGESEWDHLYHDFTAQRTISFDGSGSTELTQDGLLENTWHNDYLGVSGGTTTSIVVQGYRVDVTPLGLARVGGSDFCGDNPWTQPSRPMKAQFDVTMIPEPVTMAGLMLGVGALGGYVRRRRK